MKGVLRNLYITVDAETALRLLQQGLVQTDLAVVFPSHKEVLKRLYQGLSGVSATASFQFFFLLGADHRWTEDNVEDAGRFFYLPNYYTGEGNAPMLAFTDSAPEATVALFAKWCSGQALDEPCLQVAKAFSDKGQEEAYYITPQQREAYFGVLRSHPLTWAAQPVLLQATGVDDVRTLGEWMGEFSRFVEAEKPEVFAALQRMAVLEAERKEDKALLKFLQQEVKNLRVYNGELRAANDTMHILNFYHTQYEVLPLWYKRFGHVIKILMGKRKISFTFKKAPR